MIDIVSGLPESTVGFVASGRVTHADYKNTIYPEVRKAARFGRKINYILIIKTSLKRYTVHAWIDDALLGLRYFTRWGRIAIVSDKTAIKRFTDTFGIFIPGNAKGFMADETTEARKWIGAMSSR